jgi:hypothetical protein
MSLTLCRSKGQQAPSHLLKRKMMETQTSEATKSNDDEGLIYINLITLIIETLVKQI